MQGNLIIISSPSGGGKGTLIREILQTVPGIGYSVSFTTREMREGEEDGRDYFFVSHEKFAELISDHEFLEYAEVHGNLYGTSIKQVKSEINLGNDIILEIDVQGAKSVLQLMPTAISIFILPPSYGILARRLTERATEKQDQLDLRLRNSRGEVAQYENFEYVVVNGELEKAVSDLRHIILAERQKRTRQMDIIQTILDSFDALK